jgi:hypothetical protein
MSFALARIEEKPDGTFALLEKSKVRLGGPDGPIARHVLAQTQAEWALDGTELAVVLRPPDWGEAPVWLIWQAPEESPSRVQRIPGVSSEFSTDLMVQLEILQPTDEGTFRPLGKLTGEALSLTGGLLTPKAKWVWTAPKMAIGSTTLG